MRRVAARFGGISFFGEIDMLTDRRRLAAWLPAVVVLSLVSPLARADGGSREAGRALAERGFDYRDDADSRAVQP